MRLSSLTSIKARTHESLPASLPSPKGKQRTRSQFHRSSVVNVRAGFIAGDRHWAVPDVETLSRRSPKGTGGAGGTRTPDFRLAKAALSQLSYGPLCPVPEWWAILDSNQRPQSYQDCALTS